MKDILTVKGIFDSIISEGSTIVKSKIIKSHKDNKLFIDCLEFLLNDMKVVGISKKKISKKLNTSKASRKFENITEVFDYLLSHNTGSDSDIIEVQNYILHQDESLREFLEGLVCKSIKLGANSKVVNKALGYNLIPTFGVMLAESYSKNIKSVKDKRFILTTKMDGCRVVSIKENNKVLFFSRQGKPIDGLVDIEEEILKLPGSFVLDGELLATGSFEDSKEQFSQTMKRSRIKGNKTGLKMVCYDYIANVQDFYNGIDKTKCEQRKNRLEQLLTGYNFEYIEYLQPLYVGEDISMIDEYSKKAATNGEEGIMVNIANSEYKCSRVKSLLKVKIFNSCDVKCIRVEKGEGKYSNVVGKLICDYKGYELGVGSGLNDEQRKLFIENPELVVGKIVEVNYFEELETYGKLSLRFPTFAMIRDDKNEVSYH